MFSPPPLYKIWGPPLGQEGSLYYGWDIDGSRYQEYICIKLRDILQRKDQQIYHINLKIMYKYIDNDWMYGRFYLNPQLARSQRMQCPVSQGVQRVAWIPEGKCSGSQRIEYPVSQRKRGPDPKG